MGFRDLALKAFRPIAGFVIDAGRYRSNSWGRFFAPGSRVDWAQTAGRIYDNPIVSIGINWMQDNWHQARLVVKRQKADGTWEEDPKHPFPAAWESGNPFYSGELVDSGLIISETVSGNGFVAVLRLNNGDPCFVYLPHIYTRVIGGNGWIEGYEYRTPGSGKTVMFSPDEIIHFRHGIDPEDQKLGLSKLAAMIRDIATDNLGTTYTASLLNSKGVPGMAFTPKDAQSQPSPSDVMKWRSAFNDAFSNDGAGGMMLLPIPGKIEVPGFSPEQLAIDKLRSAPSARILSSLGLSDQALGLPSASKTYDNYDKSIEAAWRNCLIPMMMRRARILTKFVQAWYRETNVRVEYDFSQIAELQEDLDSLFERWGKAYVAGIVKRSEAKNALGLPFDDLDDVYSSEASLGIDGKAKGLIKMAAASAKARREVLESDGPDSD